MAKLKSELLLQELIEEGGHSKLREALEAIIVDLQTLKGLAESRSRKELSSFPLSKTQTLSDILSSTKTSLLKEDKSTTKKLTEERKIRLGIEANQDTLKELFNRVQVALERALETDKLAKQEVDAAWGYLKATLDIAIITTASALGGPAAGLIASGILKASPTMLASGIFSNTVMGPTELQGSDGATYYSLDVIPKGMSAPENALFRIHGSVDQVGSLLASALGSDFNHDSSVELPEALDSAMKATRVVSQNLQKAADQGEYLMATYVASHLCVPNLYDPHFKYFYVAKLLSKDDLALFVDKKKKDLETRIKETKNKILKARLSDSKFTVLDATFADYPDSYEPHTVASLRAHMAGFIKHVDTVQNTTLFLSRSVTGSLKQAKDTDLLYRTEAGSNQLKSYFRQKKVWEKFHRRLNDPKKTMRSVFEEHTSVFDTRSNPFRLSKYFDRRSEETTRGGDRKRLLLSWFIVHRLLELHTGFPIVAMMPEVQAKQLEAFAEAVVDILDLCSVLWSLYAQSDIEHIDDWDDQVYLSYLFCALITTPSLLDLAAMPLGHGKVVDHIELRFRAHDKAAKALFSETVSFSVPSSYFRKRRGAYLAAFKKAVNACGTPPTVRKKDVLSKPKPKKDLLVKKYSGPEWKKWYMVSHKDRARIGLKRLNALQVGAKVKLLDSEEGGIPIAEGKVTWEHGNFMSVEFTKIYEPENNMFTFGKTIKFDKGTKFIQLA